MWPFTRKRKTATPEIRAKFDMAQTTAENRRHWVNADNLSARASVSASVRNIVRMRSRYEVQNNSWYSGIVQLAANHVIGATGPRLQVITKNAEGNARLERAWRRWSSRIDFADMLRMMFASYWIDGEVFVMRSVRPRNFPLSLDLKMFEADQISSPWIGTAYADAFVDDGIRFDPATNEISIYVYDHHPGSNVPVSTLNGNWYSADEVLHLFRAERPGQTRGIPRATSALQMLPIMRRQELATLYTSETAANFGMYMKTNSSAIVPAVSDDAPFGEREMVRNMLTMLPEGWDIGTVSPNQPGPNYVDFQQHCLQSFSRCTNMPVPLAAGTAQRSNFSSLKGDIKNIWEPEVQVEQNRIENAIVEPVFGWFLEDAVMSPGLLADLPPIDEIDHQWNWPPLPDMDPVDAATSAKIRLSSGQSTPTKEHARRGQDWETESMRAASDFGVTPEQYKAAVFNATFGIEAGSTPAITPVAGSASSALPQGEYTSLGQRAFTNNQKRIRTTLDQFAAGEIGEVFAEQTLASIGLTPDRIAALMEDAIDGGVDDAVVSEVAV